MFNILRKIFFEYSVYTVGALYLLILILFPPYFNGYDNIYFSHALMWGESSVHTVLISYFLMYPLSALAALNPPLDPYTFLIFAINGTSLLIIARLLIRTKGTPQFSHLCAWLLVALLMYIPILFFQNALTSVFSMAVGLLLLLKASRKKNTVVSIAAVFYILLAAALRVDSCLILLPVLLIIATTEWFRGNKKLMLYCVITAAAILTINKAQSSFATTDFWGNEEMNLTTVHTSRVSLVDYSDLSSSEFQEKKMARYDEIGFTLPVRKLFFSWQFNSPLRHDNAWWEKIEKIRKSHDYSSSEMIQQRISHGLQLGKQFFSSLINLYYASIIPLILLLALLVSVLRYGLTEGLKKCTSILLFSSLFFALIALICFSGRINTVSFLSIFYVCFLFSIVSIADARLSITHRSIHFSSCGLLFCLLIFQPYTQRASIKKLFSPFEVSYRHPSIMKYLEKEMLENPKMFYFARAQDYRAMIVPSNLLLSKNIHRFERFLPMGDWESCLPYYEQRLQSFGIKSDMDLVTMKNARFVFPDEIKVNSGLQHLVDYYNYSEKANLKLVLDTQSGDECFIYRIEF